MFNEYGNQTVRMNPYTGTRSVTPKNHIDAHVNEQPQSDGLSEWYKGLPESIKKEFNINYKESFIIT